MTETDLKKIPFFKLLNLEAITPENDSSTIYKNNLLVLPRNNADLVCKNNNIKTGYENFCIKKGTLKLFPFKDFDFIGKHVVCQKCCQKFASKLSYKAHVGTGICVRTYNGPNLIYLKYKNRNYRQVRKKNKRKSEEDFHGHDIKKNLLNPEMLNTLQTRNKVYSDIIHQRNKVKEKPVNNSDKNNDEPSVKKPRGRPKKNIVSNNVEINLKKRGRPKKLNAVTVDSSSQNDNSSSSNLDIDESEEPKNLNNCSLDDAFNNNINEDGKLQSLSSKMKYLSTKFWKLFKKECKQKGVDINKYQNPTKHQTQYNEEKKGDLSAEEKEIFLKIEELEYDFKFLSKQFQGKKEYPYNDEIKLILTKISEIKQSKLKKTDMKGSIPDEGKENIQHTLQKNENETEIDINNINFDKNEKCIGIWINNSNTVSPTITLKMNDGCKSINRTNVDYFKKESTNQDSFEDNLKTLTVDKTPNITNSVKNHLNDLGLNYMYNPILNCRKCKKKFTSIAEWKLHRSEHLVKLNKIFLCKVCGLKFKIYKNFTKHLNIHKKTEQRKSYDKKNVKNLVCKICNKQYDYLRSYYAHIKTHADE
ncbi:putative histone-lysine N-methyltransferase 1 isoform X2 [Metopolophium dirhodum]|nr:putative histone-lysine N-methyltransferase 1 isoform X2 [Metopolophium dirhodum]XP_060870891.1 putative histone-lysine N-methyltransferase 1 isoform X2 [Metopolophium dirhodum]XP_060870892.1 putative histone-lysine N-methyltransferase 1 isoform X2 [Metopolophium dirhodum]XP_060870893.1 putative histone-lysine N-methyltransferase 1 isoform X2 [Metopolophium dirhodum]